MTRSTSSPSGSAVRTATPVATIAVSSSVRDRGGQFGGDRRRHRRQVDGALAEPVEGRVVRGIGPLDHGGKQRLLRVDAAIDGSLRHAEPFGDVVHLRALEPVLDERCRRSVEQLGSRSDGVTRGTCQ